MKLAPEEAVRKVERDFKMWRIRVPEDVSYGQAARIAATLYQKQRDRLPRGEIRKAKNARRSI